MSTYRVRYALVNARGDIRSVGERDIRSGRIDAAATGPIEIATNRVIAAALVADQLVRTDDTDKVVVLHLEEVK